MRDLGHEWTQEQIDRLERRIRESYREAIDDIQAKMDAFIARFLAKDEELRKRLEAEKITQADYQMWLNGQVFQRKRWQATLDDLTETLARANQLAMEIINDAVPEAFAYNANWATYTIEKQMDARGYDLNVLPRPGGKLQPVPATAAASVSFGFGLYDVNTVKRLLRDEPNLLPPSRVDIPKDKRWNMGNITRQIMQGIVQGESLEQVAQRLTKVADMNIDSARTHARTAMTGAQNAGRLESWLAIEKRTGIPMEKEWIATLDGITREAHGRADGQRRPLREAFDLTFKGRAYKLMYPCEPSGAPCMVYNCRCDMRAQLADFPDENAKRRDDDPNRVPIKDMTFTEWMAAKGAGGKDSASTLPSKEKAGILSAETKADGGRVRSLCRLKIRQIETEFGKLNTPEVVLTEERAEHIRIRHPEDYDLFEKYGVDTISDPDIVLKDGKNPNTVLMFRKIGDTNLNTVIRLSVAGEDDAGNKNSVMTFYRVRDKNLKKLIDKNKTVYRKDET